MEIKNSLLSLAGSALSGATLALLMYYREETNDKASAKEKVKQWEEKVIRDGEARALKIAQVKQDAKLAAKKEPVGNE